MVDAVRAGLKEKEVLIWKAKPRTRNCGKNTNALDLNGLLKD